MINTNIDITKITHHNLLKYKKFFFAILKHSESYLFKDVSFNLINLEFSNFKSTQPNKIEISCRVKWGGTNVKYVIRQISHRSLMIDICLETQRKDLNFNAINLVEKEKLLQIEIRHCFFIEGQKEKIIDTTYIFKFTAEKELIGNHLMVYDNIEKDIINFDILMFKEEKNDYVAIRDSFKMLDLDMDRLKIDKNSDKKLPVKFEDVLNEKEMALAEALIL